MTSMFRLVGLALSLLPLSAAAARAQDSGQTLPKLISHADAVYPQIAKTAHVTGDVVVKITTDGQSVVDAKAESGPPLLLRASEDNAKTWKFAPHSPGTFRVTYHYRFLSDDVAASFPDSSADVEIAAVPQPMSIYYATMEFGRWKAELKSPHGRLRESLELSSSGPDGEWLGVATPDGPSANDNKDNGDDEFGHKDGDVLTFSLRIAEPDGKHLQTYFVGKMFGDKIVGTFVDASGARGTWAATRIPDPVKK